MVTSSAVRDGLRSGAVLFGFLVSMVGAPACRPAPTDLRRVDEAPRHQDVEYFIVEGRSVGDKLVDYHWTRQPRSTARAKKRAELEACRTQIVPVVDAGWTPSDAVAMWLIRPDEGICDDDKIAPWLERLKRDFDGQRVKVKVVDRAGPSRAGRTMWDDALDMAKQQGAKVTKGAAIVVWPAPEE
jgi:hypothetical protein